MSTENNIKAYKEWILQSDYDYETAEAMFSATRYVYAVFMCHLCIEKIVKSQYVKRYNKVAPRSHNLLWLAEEIKLEFPEHLYRFVFQLNDASLPTRYPQELMSSIKFYSKAITLEILNKTKELQEWIKKQ
jgi:HEPN domain-containing protein